jgi:N-acetylmuramoyl-L-alanine amidase
MRGLTRSLVLSVAILALGASSATATLIAIDPGHGGDDSGAVGTLPPGTPTGLPERTDPDGQTRIYEKDVNLDVGHRLNDYLRARGYDTLMTRTQDLAGGDVPSTTTTADLAARVDTANIARADLFVSLHQNALAATTSGTETFVYYSAGQGAVVLAGLIHRQMLAALGLPDRGVKTAGFYVLRNTYMPAVLVEGAFLSNPNEAILLADPAVRQRIAEAVGAGVVEYVDRGYLAQFKTPIPTGPRYQVTAGAFRRLADARVRYRYVRRKGFTAAIASQYHPGLRRNMFFVVGGRFTEFANAESLQSKMRSRAIRANVGPLPSVSRRVPAR